MRFYEFATIKHIKPLTPPQARIYALKQQKQNVNKQLKAEKDRQKRQREQDKIRQALVRPEFSKHFLDSQNKAYRFH